MRIYVQNDVGHFEDGRFPIILFMNRQYYEYQIKGTTQVNTVIFYNCNLITIGKLWPYDHDNRNQRPTTIMVLPEQVGSSALCVFSGPSFLL